MHLSHLSQASPSPAPSPSCRSPALSWLVPPVRRSRRRPVKEKTSDSPCARISAVMAGSLSTVIPRCGSGLRLTPLFLLPFASQCPHKASASPTHRPAQNNNTSARSGTTPLRAFSSLLLSDILFPWAFSFFLRALASVLFPYDLPGRPLALLCVVAPQVGSLSPFAAFSFSSLST